MKTISAFIKHCSDDVVIDLWSTLFKAKKPVFRLTVRQLKTEYTDLLTLEYSDFGIGAQYVALWCAELNKMDKEQ